VLKEPVVAQAARSEIDEIRQMLRANNREVFVIVILELVS
jgi:hypothetical protein